MPAPSVAAHVFDSSFTGNPKAGFLRSLNSVRVMPAPPIT